MSLNSTLTNTLENKCHNKPFSLIICIKWINKKLGVDVNVNKDKKELKSDKLEFNTYCIFTEEKQNIGEKIGLVFKDYLESIKAKSK